MSEPSTEPSTERSTEPLRLSFTVACPADHAFAVWTERTSLWWPADHTTSGTPGSVITFEPHVGGRVVEQAASGDEYQWGEVVVWEPPRRMSYSWHIGHDRENATEVDITFVPVGAD